LRDAAGLHNVEDRKPGFEFREGADAMRPGRTRANKGKREKRVRGVLALMSVLASPQVQSKFAGLGLHHAGGTPASSAAFIKRETAVWGKVIKEAQVPMH
jgi:hypothetical protein